MMDYLRDVLYISNTDPLWVTITLAMARFVALSVVLFWVGWMIRGQGKKAHGPQIPLTWTWALIGWMIANALQLIVSVTRVLIVGHIRTGDQIGDVYRTIEIVVAIILALWSIIAFWRWAHPLASVSDEGVFASLAASMSMIVSDDTGTIVYVTPAFNDLAGYDGDELIGANLVTIIPERLRDAHRAGMERFLTTGESHIVGQVIPIDLLRKDGAELPIYLALATTDVDGQPWFCGSAWRRTGAIERQQIARGERQDEREAGLDMRADEADKRGKQQDERSRDQSEENLKLEEIRLHGDVSDVIHKTGADVEDVKEDVHAVKRKIVEEEAP